MNNKTAIITGGAQGIGKATAQYFLSKNTNVIIADFDEEAGQEMISEFKEITFVKADVSKEADVSKVINQAIDKTGRIDYLVNNAGITEFHPLSEITPEQWYKVIGINLTGAFLFAKYASEFLKKSKGRMVNIASTRGIMSEPDNEAYAASKGGIIALTHALANSLGPDVLVNCISPGWIEVSEWKKEKIKKKPDLSENDHKQHLSGRVGKPEDVAQLAWFLCAEQNGFITGQNFVIDGGMVKKMIYT